MNNKSTVYDYMWEVNLSAHKLLLSIEELHLTSHVRDVISGRHIDRQL